MKDFFLGFAKRQNKRIDLEEKLNKRTPKTKER
jgi:hypothetical protein